MDWWDNVLADIRAFRDQVPDGESSEATEFVAARSLFRSSPCRRTASRLQTAALGYLGAASPAFSEVEREIQPFLTEPRFHYVDELSEFDPELAASLFEHLRSKVEIRPEGDGREFGIYDKETGERIGGGCSTAPWPEPEPS